MTSVRLKILMVAGATLVAAIATFTVMMLLAMRQTSRDDEAVQLGRALAAYHQSVGMRERASEAILQAIAWRPDVRRALAEHDRDALQEMLEPTFEELKALFDIVQLHVHLHDGTVLLRVQSPESRGDSYAGHRPMNVDAVDSRTTLSGVELDDGRMSQRTVAPVMEGEAFLGLIELGLDYDESILQQLKTMHGADVRIWLTYEAAGPSGLWPAAGKEQAPLSEIFLYASTYGSRRLMEGEKYARVLRSRTAQTDFMEEGNDSYGATAVPLIGYKAKLLGVLEISRSRAQAIAMFRDSLVYTVALATTVAIAGFALLAITLNIVVLRPLQLLTHAARRQYEGDLTARAAPMSADELGLLAETFNGLSNRLTATLQQQERAIEELRAAQKAEEEANAAKDQFLAALSHELRTPLTPVLLAAESLEHNIRTPVELREDVHVIRRNVELEARLIDDLLDLTRITQDKLELHLRVTEVHSLLASAISVCRGEAEAKGLKIETSFMADSQWVRADAARLQQVFWNLVKNAVKFTPPGATVAISTENGMVNGEEQLIVKVVDSGIGMSEEVQEKLFNVFEQGSRWITRTFGGLGLGLAISKKIVDRHGGTITGYSEGPGKGSTFVVRLPTVGEPAATYETPKTAAPTVPGLRILLVEDHPATGFALKRLLKDSGHSVVLAGSVHAALEAAASGSFDLVISDLGLPDGDGADLMRQLASRWRLSGIAVSGFGMQEDIHRSSDAGFVSHLTKPITADQLRHAIADVWAKLNRSAAGLAPEAN